MTKKTKKMFTPILSIIVVMLLFAGCSSGTKEKAVSSTVPSAASSATPESKPVKKTEIKFWTLWDGADADTARKIVEEYNNTSTTAHITMEFQDNAQYYTKLKTSLLGGTGPDLAISHIGGNITDMQAGNLLLPLNDEAKRLGVNIDFNGYSPGPTDEAKIGGKNYAVPLDNLVRVFMYNKAILKDAGLLDDNGKPKIEPGFDGFMKALQQIKNKVPGVAPLAMTMKPPQLVLTWLTFYYQLGGGEFLNLGSKKATFDDGKAALALKHLHDMYIGYVPPKLTDPAGLEMFKAKKAAFYMDGTWSIYAAAQPLGSDFGVMGFPQFFDKNVEVSTSHGFILPVKKDRTDAQTKAALEFIKWFADNNWKWAQAGHVPGYLPALNTKEFKGLPYHTQFMDSKREIVAVPVIPGTLLHTAAEIKDPIQLGVFGDLKPEDAVKKIKDNLDKLLPQLVK